MSVLYNVPKFFEIDVSTSDNGTAMWTLTSLAHNSLYQTVYQNVMYYVFTFVLPLLILTIVNTRVILAYRRTLQRQTSQRASQLGDSRRSTLSGSLVMTAQGGKKASEKNITLVMIMIVLIFMACQAPARLVQVSCPADTQTCPTRSQTCPTRSQTCPTRSQTCPTRSQTCPTHSQTRSKICGNFQLALFSIYNIGFLLSSKLSTKTRYILLRQTFFNDIACMPSTNVD
jgi:hypothetical protein